MLVTNQMAFLFQKHVLDEKLSPYDAICHMKKEMPGQHIPCLSTWYKHINVGDVGVRYGETPYHPKKKPKRPKPHPAKTVPGRLTLNDRPAGAQNRSRFGHYEMDTVVSGTNGRGGLLVLVDRKSRRYIIELLEHVTQDDIIKALKRIISRKAKPLEKCVPLRRTMAVNSQTRKKSKLSSDATFTTRGPMRHGKKVRWKTAIDLSADGIPRKQTSANTQEQTCINSKKRSIRSIAKYSMAKQHMRWTVPIQMQHKASGCPSVAKDHSKEPGRISLGRRDTTTKKG